MSGRLLWLAWRNPRRMLIAMAAIEVQSLWPVSWWGPLWCGRQDFTACTQAALGLAVRALVSALYPALRAARFRLTEALRKVWR